uniref:BTB domain-containing protein n=1 Tax=Ditylenchus dipsaci TaxID=166011 RepID=A0A915CPN5_9BILA
MEIYLKDCSGHAYSPINSCIKGLFFSVNPLSDGSLPKYSPFGNVRLTINPSLLLDPNTHNMYAQKHLLLLDPERNTFLKITSSNCKEGSFKFEVSRNVWVEMFYTENVLIDPCRLENVSPVGITGPERKSGLPYKAACPICNLDIQMENNKNLILNSFDEEVRATENLNTTRFLLYGWVQSQMLDIKFTNYQYYKLNSELIHRELMSDATLCVEQRKFNVHKAILATRSEYFRTMLCSGLKECSEQSRKVVLPQNMSVDALKILLHRNHILKYVSETEIYRHLIGWLHNNSEQASSFPEIIDCIRQMHKRLRNVLKAMGRSVNEPANAFAKVIGVDLDNQINYSELANALLQLYHGLCQNKNQLSELSDLAGMQQLENLYLNNEGLNNLDAYRNYSQGHRNYF